MGTSTQGCPRRGAATGTGGEGRGGRGKGADCVALADLSTGGDGSTEGSSAILGQRGKEIREKREEYREEGEEKGAGRRGLAWPWSSEKRAMVVPWRERETRENKRGKGGRGSHEGGRGGRGWFVRLGEETEEEPGLLRYGGCAGWVDDEIQGRPVGWAWKLRRSGGGCGWWFWIGRGSQGGGRQWTGGATEDGWDIAPKI